MYGEKKEHSRSIRMTKTVLDFVNGMEGKGFNQKFENMVLYCMTEYDNISLHIEQQKKMLEGYVDKVASLRDIVQKIDNMKWDIERVIEKAERVIESSRDGK